MEKVILTDSFDKQIGTLEKIEAHRKALLHRAISVFICNTKGEWLLQQRALSKYHSGGLWTNTCCTHPAPDETNIDAANRRLKFEMGMRSELSEIFSFIYKEPLDNELTEYEYDHVFLGITDQAPNINTDEAMAWKYISYDSLMEDMEKYPENYTVWFEKIVHRVAAEIKKLSI